MGNNAIQIVINPIAGGRRAGQQIQTIRREFSQHFNTQPIVHVTAQKEDGFRVGHQLRQSGAKLVVVAGGEGTIHEVINGLFMNGADFSTKCEIGLLNLGSGGDFARGLGLPKSLSSQIALLAKSEPMNVDLGLVHYDNANGQPQQRIFMNEFQLGIGAKAVGPDF